MLTAKERRFTTGKAIFRGYHFGAPASCCIFGHIRHNWAAKDANYGFGRSGL